MSLQENVHSTQTCLDFLKFIYPIGPWTLTSISDSTLKARTFSDREIGDMQRWLETQNGQVNLYWQINKLRCHPETNKATLQQVLELNRLHVDLDPRKGQFDRNNERQLILSLLDNEPRLKEIGLPGGPSLIIDSGNGFWGFWNLAQAMPIIGANEQELRECAAEFGRYNRWIVEVLNDALNASSKDGAREIADTCHNLDRIARLPGTFNIPDAKKKAAGYQPVESRIYASYPQRLYSLEQFKKSDVVSWGAGATQADLNAINVGNIVRTLPGSNDPWEIANELKRIYPQIGQRTLELICLGEYTEQESGDDDINDKLSSTGEFVTNRSKAHWRVNRSLQQFGVPLNVILGVLCDERLPISAHGREPDDKRQGRRKGRELIRFNEIQIKKCAVSIANQRKQETLEAQVLLGDKPESINTKDNNKNAESPKKNDAPIKKHPANLEDAIDDLNKKHAVLLQEGGKTRVLSWTISEIDSARKVPTLQTFKDFENRYLNRTYKIGEKKGTKDKKGDDIFDSLGKIWLKHPKRKQFLEMRYLPNQPTVVGEYLNLWQNWGVEAKEGNWSLMKDHILKILANGNKNHADYIIKWAAWSVQHPDEPAESALVFKGGEGTGKGAFAKAMRWIFGQHGLHVHSPMHLTGRFNAHLRDCSLLFADEAFAVNDKKTNGILKGLITEPEIPVEGKGVNLITARNNLHIIMASNEDWVVPAGIDARRFAIFEVNAEHARDDKYFNPLFEQLKNGGLSAMFYDLLHMDLGEWHPRNPPQTEALRKQKEYSLRKEYEAILRILEEGIIPGEPVPHQPNTVYSGSKNEYRFRYMGLMEAIRDEIILAPSLTPHRIGKALAEFDCKPVWGPNGRAWEFPSLEEMRKIWDEKFWQHTWPETITEWHSIKNSRASKNDSYEEEEIPF